MVLDRIARLWCSRPQMVSRLCVFACAHTRLSSLICLKYSHSVVLFFKQTVIVLWFCFGNEQNSGDEYERELWKSEGNDQPQSNREGQKKEMRWRKGMRKAHVRAHTTKWKSVVCSATDKSPFSSLSSYSFLFFFAFFSPPSRLRCEILGLWQNLGLAPSVCTVFLVVCLLLLLPADRIRLRLQRRQSNQSVSESIK